MRKFHRIVVLVAVALAPQARSASSEAGDVETLDRREGSVDVVLDARSAASASDAARRADAGSTIPAVHQVHPELYRSAHIVAADARDLAALGIKTVLSLENYGGDDASADAEARFLSDVGVDYVWQPMDPSRKPTIDEIDRALETIADSRNQPVLVHCKYGHDRTGIVVAAYRIRYDGWSVAQATKEMRDLGHRRALYWWDDVLNEVR
jgi:uncharacterized protein (TIGR01244 family)